MIKRILVFPCGSEIGLEIYRSLRFSMHFELVGASSADDHGRFVYENYVGGLPFHEDPDFLEALERVIIEHNIHAIYPAMDSVAQTLQMANRRLGVVVIGSTPIVTTVCSSKTATYKALSDIVPLPAQYQSLEDVREYPVFIKPDRGYGSRNTLLAHDARSAIGFLEQFAPGSMLILEYLPGEEWTIDCFSDRHGHLRFSSARSRSRVSNGISVRTVPCDRQKTVFDRWARAIHNTLRPRGAWFFQAKLDANAQPKLLEVAARLGGSSGLSRCRGVNLALLSAFDAFDENVSIETNQYTIEMDRALDSRYKLDLHFRHVFVDLDDCLIVRGQVNRQLLCFLYKAISEGKHLTLITRHKRDPQLTLRDFRIGDVFDRIIHLRAKSETKSAHIDTTDAIFIDDSYTERLEVQRALGILTFSPDMIEALL
jgi:hypothetical protein